MDILLVEDDQQLARGLRSALCQGGDRVEWVGSGEAALDAVASESFDLVILDVGLPGIDGFEVVRTLRGRKNAVPVLMLTARDEIDDRVRGLDLGADDYLVKPVALRELAARVRALTRRGQLGGDARVVLGYMEVDLAAKRAWIDDVPLSLSAREWSVLEYLLRRMGRIVSKEQILQSLSGWSEEISPNAIEMYVHRLRGKLAGSGVEIRTVRGLGYLLEKPIDDKD